MRRKKKLTGLHTNPWVLELAKVVAVKTQRVQQQRTKMPRKPILLRRNPQKRSLKMLKFQSSNTPNKKSRHRNQRRRTQWLYR